MSKNRLVIIGRNKQDIQYSEIENYLKHVRFCYFTDQNSLDTLSSYFQLLTELIDKYNFKAFIEKFENIESILQNLMNNLSTTNEAVNQINTQISSINNKLIELEGINNFIEHINLQINIINSMLQDLQLQTGNIPQFNLIDYIKFGNSAKYILYGKTQEADTQIRLNKNFIYLIPFRLSINLTLDKISVYKLFDRKTNGKVYIAIYESDNEDNPTNKIFETEININRMFGLMSTDNTLDITLNAGRIYYFAITTNDNLLLRGVTVNNIKILFGVYTKNGKTLTGFILPNRTNILPDYIDIQKLVPYFDKLPAIYVSASNL